MNLSIRRAIGSSTVVAIALVSVIASPAAATTAPVSDYGNTVECRYQTEDHGPAYEWALNKFVVTAPVLFAKSGTQTVGWRFVVTRADYSDNVTWQTTYRSPIQKASATTTKAASFTSKSVAVALPNVDNIKSLEYHVTLKLFWYRANGTVQSQASYLMPWMKWLHRSHYYYGDYDDTCPGGFYEGP